MPLVAKRIVDKPDTETYQMWLNGADCGGNVRMARRSTKEMTRGHPQGGVISPLLANIYLNVLDTLWAVKKVQERLEQGW